jgi:ferrochelatase
MNHANPARPTGRAVLLVSGTPDAPTPAAVRRYLKEFLSDPRVIDMPRWLWLPILYGFILPLRPRRSAHAYASIWTDRGSPLRVYSEALAERLDVRLRDATANRARVALAMRYGQPSIATVIERLRGRPSPSVVLPLYPQYSGTSTGTVIDAVDAVLQRALPAVQLRCIRDYHDDPEYISTLCATVENFWKAHGRAPKLLLSFHGIPERYVGKGDPYREHCRVTAQRLRERLRMSEDDFIVAFQSRVGREPWLKPYTDEVLAQLPAQGVRHVHVLCPGFAVDCLKRSEIAMHNRALFIASPASDWTTSRR